MSIIIKIVLILSASDPSHDQGRDHDQGHDQGHDHDQDHDQGHDHDQGRVAWHREPVH